MGWWSAGRSVWEKFQTSPTQPRPNTRRTNASLRISAIPQLQPLVRIFYHSRCIIAVSCWVAELLRFLSSQSEEQDGQSGRNSNFLTHITSEVECGHQSVSHHSTNTSRASGQTRMNIGVEEQRSGKLVTSLQLIGAISLDQASFSIDHTSSSSTFRYDVETRRCC